MKRAFDVESATLAASIAGQGPTFLWLHALTSSRRREDRRAIFDWSGLTDEFTVARYDTRGHGESTGQPQQEQYEWPRLATDLLRVLDELGPEPAFVGGASMGAATSLWAALAAPGRIRGLVLATPPWAWDAKAVQADGWRKAAHIAEKYGAPELARRTAGLPPPALFAGRPELADTGADIADELLPSVLRGAADSDLPDADALAGIQTPALILAWRGDPEHPVATAERLAELLPDNRLHVADELADTGAWPELVRSFFELVGHR